MDTWGTRGFSAAAITGGLLGLSTGSGTVNADAPEAGRRVPVPARPEAPRAQRGEPARAYGATRYGAPERPESPVRPPLPARPETTGEYRAAEQTMISPLLSDPELDRPAARREPEADRPTGRHGAPRGVPTGVSGLRPDVHAARSAVRPSSPAPFSGVPTGSAHGSELDSFGGYGETALDRPAEPRSWSRGTDSRDARPGYPGSVFRPATTALSGSDGFLSGNLAALSMASDPRLSGTPVGTLDQPPARPAVERPMRSVELVGAGRAPITPVRPYGGSTGPDEDDGSALGSLDSSALFGTLSRRYR